MSTVPFNKMTGYIWYDGQSVNWLEANLHVLTHGLHYGSSAFEGVRIYNSKPFKLKEHIERLHHSANSIGFSVPYSVQELCEQFMEQIRLNEVFNGYGRPAVWRGSETMLIGGEGTKIHTMIAVWKSFENRRSEIRDRGISMCISKWRKPNADASPFSAKVASIYTLGTMVKNEATARGFDDSLMLDSEGNITEGSTSNVFFVFGDELHTPIPDCFLNGITRQTIISIASKKGIKCVERHITLDDINASDAAFLTGTAIEIMPIQKIEDRSFDIHNKMISILSEEYSKLVNI
jgi:branched-chain amino acid aminotransferase